MTWVDDRLSGPVRLSNDVVMPQGSKATIRIVETGDQDPRFDFMICWDNKDKQYRMKGNTYQLKDAQEMSHIVLKAWALVVCKSARRRIKKATETEGAE